MIEINGIYVSIDGIKSISYDGSMYYKYINIRYFNGDYNRVEVKDRAEYELVADRIMNQINHAKGYICQQ